MSRNDVMAASNNFDYAFDTDLERYIDELPEHREENFRWQMHPELLSCIREGLFLDLQQQSKDNYNNYFFKALPNDIKIIRMSFFIIIGVIFHTAYEGGLPVEKGAAICLKYRDEIARLESIPDFISLFNRMIIQFAHEVRSHKEYYTGVPVIDLCKHYIFEHIYENIDLTELAKHCKYSLTSLQHIFRLNTGMTLTRYIRKEKILKTKFLLEFTNDSCLQISLKLSYCSQSYFIKQFKSETGMTPDSYRKKR